VSKIEPMLTTKARRIIAMTSSITALPSIVAPTSESRTFMSIRVLTVTPTEVAVSIRPITILSDNVKLKLVKVESKKQDKKPNINGARTPPIATIEELLPIFLSLDTLISRPDTKRRNKIPSSATKTK